MTAIKNHLSDVDRDDREFIRYFTLHTLANNRTLTDDKLRLATAALAKALNSVSRKGSFLNIEPVDQFKTVFAVDLRELDWDEDGFKKWNTLIAAYPYAVKPIRSEAQSLHSDIKELYEIRGFLRRHRVHSCRLVHRRSAFVRLYTMICWTSPIHWRNLKQSKSSIPSLTSCEIKCSAPESC